jgi:hypothetical protein
MDVDSIVSPRRIETGTDIDFIAIDSVTGMLYWAMVDNRIQLDYWATVDNRIQHNIYSLKE